MTNHHEENRQTVNSLINTVREQDAYTDIKNSLKDSATFLKQFCGPFALNAGSLASTQTISIDNFTKDGVTIYSHLSAGTPVEETARRLIEFIGKRVDSRCHDGTTTSMMTAASLGYRWMEALAPKSRRERHQSAKTISRIVNILNNLIDEQSFTVDELVEGVKKTNPDVDEDKLRRRIFYDTIMTSSKGDEELAEKLSLVLESLPKELYNYARFENNNIESENRFEINTQQSDISIQGSFSGNPSTLPGNKRMGSSYELEDVNLVVIGNPVLDKQYESDYLINWIVNQLLPRKNKKNVEIPVLDSDGNQKVDENQKLVFKVETQEIVEQPVRKLDKPMVLLAPRFESTILRIVQAYNDTVDDDNRKIYLFQFYQDHTNSYHAMCKAIAVMAGNGDKSYLTMMEAANRNDLDLAMIPCRFEYSGNRIDISDLYKKDGRKFHPFYYDKGNVRYHNVLNEMKETIDYYSKGNLGPNNKTDKLVYDLIYIQRCMICQKIIEMRVCGTAHELTANTSVVEDAMGSALSVVEEGMVLSGYQKILSGINKLPEDDPMITATAKAISEVVAASYDLSLEEVENYKHSLVDFDDAGDTKFLYNNAFDEAPFSPRNALTEFANGSSNAILQPKAGYKEQFVRIADIISKLVMTYAVLTARKFDPSVGR